MHGLNMKSNIEEKQSMKSKEELNALKEEVETQNKKLHELTEEELEQVSGGVFPFNDKNDVVVTRAELNIY